MIGKLEIFFEASGWQETDMTTWLHTGSSKLPKTNYKIQQKDKTFILYNEGGLEIGAFDSLTCAKDVHAMLVEFSSYLQNNLGMVIRSKKQ